MTWELLGQLLSAFCAGVALSGFYWGLRYKALALRTEADFAELTRRANEHEQRASALHFAIVTGMLVPSEATEAGLSDQGEAPTDGNESWQRFTARARERIKSKVESGIEQREQEKPRKCAYSNCGAPAVPFSYWCALHGSSM